jgi:type VI secretion system protein ImpH
MSTAAVDAEALARAEAGGDVADDGGPGTLARALRDDPTAFSFFQAVRLLERLYPGRRPVGHWEDPADEVARFGASTSLGFPASEIQALTLPTDDAAASLTVNFFGLVGPQGVLPHGYTEHAGARARAKDTAFRDFLDMFHRRALSLFYRAWKKQRFTVAHETRGEDRLYDHLLDLAGFGTAGLRDRLPLRDGSLAFYAGLLAMRARPADGLARLIGDYFDVPTSVQQFVGEWRRIGVRGQCALGEESDAGRLGHGVLGDAAWDPRSRVRLRLGPLTRAQFDAFLPRGAAHAELRALARVYADEQVGVEAQLVLARDEVPACALGATGAGPRPPTLGRGTWLASRPLARDPDETTMQLC